jgi:murein DD-endopeptidase MepM/ murein hydrolase activator NlpD
MERPYFIGFILLIIHSYCFGQSVKQTTVLKNDTIYISFVNPFLVPLELHLTPLDSTKSYVGANTYGIVKYQDTLNNAIVIPISKVKDTSAIDVTDYIKFRGTFGDPNSKIDKDYRYSLPFPKGKRYKIVQSFGGKFSHYKTHSRYAIDIGTQIGDTITAARPGTVVFVKEDSKEYCRSSKCADKGNKIIVVHGDGSLGHYVHLDFEGALVDVGERIEDSQPIGISGMTGFTTTPHLHFVLLKAGSVSIPFKFKGQKRKKLKQGRYYKRVHGPSWIPAPKND